MGKSKKGGRETHVGKTNGMRKNYQKRLEQLECEPTSGEELDFSPTDRSGEELIEPTNKRRPTNIKQEIKDHFKINWVKYSLGILTAAIVFLLYDSRVAIAVFSNQLTTQKELIHETKTYSLNNQKEIQDQALKVVKIETILPQIEKDVNEIKTDIREVRNSIIKSNTQNS